VRDSSAAFAEPSNVSAYTGFLDFYNFKLGRSLSSFDATHNFVGQMSLKFLW